MKPSKILVIGDSCEDIFIYGDCERLCPDAPVPVLIPTYTKRNLGMAGNVFANLSSLKIDTELLTNEESITKTRYADDHTGHTFIRIDNKSPITPLKDVTNINYNRYDLIIISDYNKGFLDESSIDWICRHHPFVFIDTKKHINNFCDCAYIIKINEKEYNSTTQHYGEQYMYKYKHNTIVTLGQKGCKYNDKIFEVPEVLIRDLSGAGDSFMAGLCAKFLETNNIEESILFANECATVAVQHRGVVTINPLKEIHYSKINNKEIYVG